MPYGSTTRLTPSHPPPSEELRTAGERVGRLLEMLRRRWPIALTVFLITLGTTFALMLRGSKEYEATAQILLQPSDQVSQLIFPGVAPSPVNGEREVDTDVRLITSEPVADAVRRELGASSPGAALATKVSVSGQTTSNLVSITARASDPEQARRIATAFAVQYRAYRRATLRGAIDDAIASGERTLAALPASARRGPVGSALRTRLTELQTNAAIGTGGVQVLQRASPVARASQHRILAGVVSVLVATILAIVAARLHEWIDPRLLSREDAELAFGLPVLASARVGRRRLRRNLATTPDVDAFASLASRLTVGMRREEARIVMVSSTGASNVASGVAEQLATQIAAQHRRVVLIDARLRGNSLVPLSNGHRPSGLTGLLLGAKSLDDELGSLPDVAVAPFGEHTNGSNVSYRVLWSGGPVSNAGALLGRPELEGVIRRAAAQADVVLIEGPPPSPASDSLPVAAISDDILLAAELRSTTREDASEARNALGPLYGKVLGMVLTVPTRGYSGGERRGLAAPPQPTDNGHDLPTGPEPPVHDSTLR